VFARFVLTLFTLLVSAAALVAQTSSPTVNVNSTTQSSPCLPGTYQKILADEFAKPINGPRLATIEVIPSFTPEYALVFEQSPSGVVLTRISFPKSLWQLLRVMNGPSKSEAECVSIARTVELDCARIPIDPEIAKRMVDGLSKKNFSSDKCVRSLKGDCLVVFDGTQYVVTLADGRSTQITGLIHSRGETNENPAISAWIVALFQEIVAVSGS
jgi:hypothetical protein